MTLHRYLNPRSSVERLYMKQTEGCRGLIHVEDCITIESRVLYDYLKESKEDLLRKSQKGKGMKERGLCMKESYKANLWIKPGTLHTSFRKVDKEWVFEERDRRDVIC